MKKPDGTPGRDAPTIARGRPFVAFLRRRRGAPQPNVERERADYEVLRATERYLSAVSWYRYGLENPTVRHVA